MRPPVTAPSSVLLVLVAAVAKRLRALEPRQTASLNGVAKESFLAHRASSELKRRERAEGE